MSQPLQIRSNYLQQSRPNYFLPTAAADLPCASVDLPCAAVDDS
jgi:hypothetical protein